jgi:hypothetical protein
MRGKEKQKHFIFVNLIAKTQYDFSFYPIEAVVDCLSHTMNMLFIGGSKDGQKLDIPDELDCFRVEVMPEPDWGNVSQFGRLPAVDEVARIETYLRCRLGTTEFFHLSTLSTIEVFDKLLANYKP